MPGQDERARRRDAALALPDPPLRDEIVALRAWRADDVPDRLIAFADPLVQQVSWAHIAPYTTHGVTGRDTVMFSLLPGELQ